MQAVSCLKGTFACTLSAPAHIGSLPAHHHIITHKEGTPGSQLNDLQGGIRGLRTVALLMCAQDLSCTGHGSCCTTHHAVAKDLHREHKGVLLSTQEAHYAGCHLCYYPVGVCVCTHLHCISLPAWLDVGVQLCLLLLVKLCQLQMQWEGRT